MRAVKSIQQFLNSSLESVHKYRIRALFWAVCSLLVGGKLSLTGLGRSARGRTSPKHNIKRVNRLLGNRLLHKQTDTTFAQPFNNSREKCYAWKQALPQFFWGSIRSGIRVVVSGTTRVVVSDTLRGSDSKKQSEVLIIQADPGYLHGPAYCLMRIVEEAFVPHHEDVEVAAFGAGEFCKHLFRFLAVRFLCTF